MNTRNPTDKKRDLVILLLAVVPLAFLGGNTLHPTTTPFNPSELDFGQKETSLIPSGWFKKGSPHWILTENTSAKTLTSPKMKNPCSAPKAGISPWRRRWNAHTNAISTATFPPTRGSFWHSCRRWPWGYVWHGDTRSRFLQICATNSIRDCGMLHKIYRVRRNAPRSFSPAGVLYVRRRPWMSQFLLFGPKMIRASTDSAENVWALVRFRPKWV